MNVERYVAVEVNAFSHGMKKLFEGVAEVFTAIGVAEPERLEAEKQKWASGAGDDGAEHSDDTKVDEAVKGDNVAQDTPATNRVADTAATISLDDITRIIVQKIKQGQANNDKIIQLLNSYGAAKVSDLPKELYEAFVTDIAAL